MKRVLWVTPVPPDHDGGGGHMRLAFLLDAMRRRWDVEICLVIPGPLRDERVRKTVDRVIEVGVDFREWSRWGHTVRRVADLWGAVAHPDPREVVAWARFRRAAGRAVSSLDADVVLVEYIGMAHLRREVGNLATPAPWVLTCHNLPSRMDEQQAAVATGRRRWLFEKDAVKARRVERRAVGMYDRVIVMSEEDVASLGPGPVQVVPNGIDLRRFIVTSLPSGPRIVFTGALYTGPNRDGAVWFCNEVLPLIQSAVPDVQVQIVGAEPPPEVLALGRFPGVSVHGDVPAIGQYLEWARVAVVPLRIGSGTRIKALEALAAGRPVVGTTVGLEGLRLVDGHHVLIADDAASFAEGCARLLRDDATARSLALAGRAMVESCYGWEQIGDQFCAVVEELLVR